MNLSHDNGILNELDHALMSLDFLEDLNKNYENIMWKYGGDEDMEPTEI